MAEGKRISLPGPPDTVELDVAGAIWARRSRRAYVPEPLKLGDAGALLWAAQGLVGRKVRRSAPSAGATYPLDAWLAAGEVEGLGAGSYRYLTASHELELVREGDLREALGAAALGQGFIAGAPAVVALSAVYSRITGRYGERGVRYADMEAGAAAENLHLMAEALELGTVVVGAFYDGDVAGVLGMSGEEVPLLLMPVGREALY
jgi:SagB-type dehydrogenase family enzyme